MKKLIIIINKELNNFNLPNRCNDPMKLSYRYYNLKRSIKHYNICTISGGQDSNCMCLILLHQNESRLTILYCQHFWQMKNFLTSKLLANLSFFFNIPYYIMVPKKKLVTENAARNWRKKNFFRIIEITREKNLLIGQTHTDQTETFFSYLFRGTSPKPFYRNHDKIEKKKVLNFPIFIRKRQLKKKFHTLKFLKSKQLMKSFPKTSIFKSKNIKNSNFFNVSRFDENTLKKNFLVYEKISISFILYTKTLSFQPKIQYPISEQSRFLISKCLIHYQFPVLTDLTNLSTFFYRNKIRQNLFPLIRYLFQRQLENTISTFLNNLSFDQKILKNKNKELQVLLKNKNTLIRIKKNNITLCKNENSLLKEIFYFYQEIKLTRLQTIKLKEFL